ncbi:integrative conjugative element protein, RAQPRD family [Salinisphaera orenii]|uniref:integrative conjugative element protein, RAQPRD family n=1 Tax=Salinisphaera orenii TaxID=856731 RepID=UPI000DBE9BAE
MAPRTASHFGTRAAATVTLIALTVGAGLLQPAAASGVRDPVQRQDLARLQAQLKQVDRTIDRLAARQRRTAGQHPHVVLDVAALRADVHKIRSGIQHYLAPPRLPPRHPAPLDADYAKHSADDTP